MSNPNCKVCERSGLPILFTYHAVVATDEKFAPKDAAKLLSHQASIKDLNLPALKHSRYVLRSLRPGTYLYIYHETPPEVLKRKAALLEGFKAPKDRDPDAAHWEVLRVVKGGALVPSSEPQFDTAAPFSCTMDNGSHVHTTITYRLPDAHAATGIWVAVSANLWNKKLRNAHKKNPKTMKRIDIAAALKGGGPDILPATAEWLEAHVADFALGTLKHGKRDGISPVVEKLKDTGKAQAARMVQLAQAHPKTQGKGFVYALPDPVGTAEAAADLSRARYQVGLDYAESQRQPVGSIGCLEFIHNRIHFEEQEKVKAAYRPLQEKDLYDVQGRPLFAAKDRAQVPAASEIGKWVWYGVMRPTTLIEGQRLKNIPTSARWIQLERQPDMGGVIAPASDIADVQTIHASRKVNRLHDREAVKTFKQQFQTQLDKFNALVGQHDADRAKLLDRQELKDIFGKHYDPHDPNTPGASHIPALTYMEEVGKALVAWGGVSTELGQTVQTLLNSKPDSEEGWALRAMVANQAGLFSTLATGLESYGDWLTNPGNKLDKSFDTLKALLSDEDVKSHLPKGRFGWLTGAGMGLSFGVSGFMAGAASELLARELKNAAMQSPAVQTAMKRAQAFHAWCHQQSVLVSAIVQSKPPARPIVARVKLNMAQALEVLVDSAAQGEKFNRSTRKLQTQWESMPAAARGQTVELEFLTTEDELRKAGSVENLATRSSAIRVPVRNANGMVIVANLTAEELGVIYRKACRFDGIKDAMKDVAAVLKKPGSLAYKIPASAFAGIGKKEGWYSLAGAWLQWRCLTANQAKMDELRKRLATQKDLTAEQTAAIRDTIELTQLGAYDNWCGVGGGIAELVGVGANALRLAGTASIGLAAAALAGMGGAFMNAAQNWHKASTKWGGDEKGMAWAYGVVGGAYFMAGAFFFASGAEIAFHWFLERKALEVGLRGTAGAAFGQGMRLRYLSLTGWGVALTVLAFGVEGIVAYMDRTPLEEWVENSYFGNEPKYRGPTGKGTDPAQWDAEMEAFAKALNAANIDGAASA